MLLKSHRTSILILLLALSAEMLPAAELLSPVESFLNAQAGIQTWSADFIQTRYLKTLAQPLTATGHVWFAAPNQFRWELGKPAKTIALRSGPDMLLIYPGLKRVERYPLDGTQAGPWKDASALLEAGFPRNRAEIDRQFEILSQTATNGSFDLTLRPRQPGSRRMMPRITISFDPAGYRLFATELELADGSRMRNEFSNQQTNQPLPDGAFSKAIPEGYKLVEPGKGAR